MKNLEKIRGLHGTIQDIQAQASSSLNKNLQDESDILLDSANYILEQDGDELVKSEAQMIVELAKTVDKKNKTLSLEQSISIAIAARANVALIVAETTKNKSKIG